jgi:hypothetical protein
MKTVLHASSRFVLTVLIGVIRSRAIVGKNCWIWFPLNNVLVRKIYKIEVSKFQTHRAGVVKPRPPERPKRRYTDRVFSSGFSMLITACCAFVRRW